MKNEKRVIIPITYFMLFGIMGLLLVTCHNNIEFTRIPDCSHRSQLRDSSFYVEHVLIRNVPKNDLEQSKIMIAYFDSVGLSIDDLITKMSNVNLYLMSFSKSTYTTRKFYLKGKRSVFLYEIKTCLGFVGIKRCKNDTTKWETRILRFRYFNGSDNPTTVILSNACEPTGNNVLVNYYNELIDKKNANRKGE